MNDFTPLSALVGGMLIGLAATIYLVSHGRIAGITGIVAGALLPDDEGADARRARRPFLAGLVLAGAGWQLLDPAVFGAPRAATAGALSVAVVAGLIVGFGTRLANGCTSGHGVCGLSRLSPRSAVAVAVFMAVAMVTVPTARALGWS